MFDSTAKLRQQFQVCKFFNTFNISVTILLLFGLPLVVCFLDRFVQHLCLHSIDCLPLHAGKLDDYVYDVSHGCIGLSV